jgi:hypothetical protein
VVVVGLTRGTGGSRTGVGVFVRSERRHQTCGGLFVVWVAGELQSGYMREA